MLHCNSAQPPLQYSTETRMLHCNSAQPPLQYSTETLMVHCNSAQPPLQYSTETLMLHCNSAQPPLQYSTETRMLHSNSAQSPLQYSTETLMLHCNSARPLLHGWLPVTLRISLNTYVSLSWRHLQRLRLSCLVPMWCFWQFEATIKANFDKASNLNIGSFSVTKSMKSKQKYYSNVSNSNQAIYNGV